MLSGFLQYKDVGTLRLAQSMKRSGLNGFPIEKILLIHMVEIFDPVGISTYLYLASLKSP